MNNDQIFSWILSHPKNYPGKHQESQPRTLHSFKPVEPKSQFHLIFKSLSEYIKENLASGKSINVKGLGAFSFEIDSSYVEAAVYTTIDFKKQLDEQRAERKHVHKIRPCFVVDSKLKYFLSRYPGKEELSPSKSQNSVYQKGFGMVFCNPTPIAASCYLGKEVVQAALNAFIEAVSNLAQLGHSLSIDLGFIKININNKNLSYTFKSDFSTSLNKTNFESKIKKAEVATSSFWKTSSETKWMNSSLSGLFPHPDADKVNTLAEKTLALKIMSLDMNSTEKTGTSQIKSTLGSAGLRSMMK